MSYRNRGCRGTKALTGRVALLAALAVALAPRSSFAAERWTMVRSGSMTVIGDESASTLRDVAVQLEQFRLVVGGLIHDADRPPSLPTVVFVFGTRKAMQPFLPLSNGKPASLAGFFHKDDEVNYVVMSLEGFEESAAIAYHEYTHLLVGNAVRSIPVWLNEGLAEYYSTYQLSANGREAFIGRPPAGRLALLRRQHLPLSDVIEVDRSSALYNESQKRSIFYAQAWAVMHYVLSQPNGGAAINKYAAEVAEGKTPHEAFFGAFGQTPAALDKQLRGYVQRFAFTGTQFRFRDRLTVTPPSPPRVLSAAEANAWLGDLQRRIRREAEAAPRIDAAVTAEPDNGIARLAAGLMRLSQARRSEGLQELERAGALAPDDFLTHYVRGVALLRADGDLPDSDVEQAVSSLRRAAALKPDSADAHAWLAYGLMQLSRSLADARTTIERAMTLAPGRVEFRLRWADIRLLQGDYADARQWLTALAAIRTDSFVAAGAAARLATLDRYESAERARQARSVDVQPAFASVPDSRVRLELRDLKPGEERTFGLLTAIECRSNEVRFRVDAAGRELVVASPRMDDIELISYLDDKDFSLACGIRAQPDAVLVTWMPAAASAERSGAVVAVEFLPKGYVP